MKLNDIVFVFDTYDLLTGNVVDSLINKNYHIAEVKSFVARVKGSNNTYYAFDLFEKDEKGKALVFVNNDTSSIRYNDNVFITRRDLFDVLEKYVKRNPSDKERVSEIIDDINKLFTSHGFEVIVPNTRFDTYGGCEE